MKTPHNLKLKSGHTLATRKGRRTMQKTWAVLGLLLLLSMFIVSSCTVSAADDRATDGPARASEPTPVNVLGPAAARDVVLATLAETCGDKAPIGSLSWVEANVTAEGLVGGSAFQYTANGWVVKVTFPVVNPIDTVYHVVVRNEAAGFDWEGDVDADGVVVETADPEATRYNPTAARDAVLAYLAESYGDRAPALGLTWAETDVTPGMPDRPLLGSTSLQYVVADWVMTLSYPVVRPDLVVYTALVENAALGFRWEGVVNAVGQVTEQRVIVGETPAPVPVATPTPIPTLVPSWTEPVDNWWGEIVGNPPGSQWDDYFRRQIVNGGQYGIESLDSELQAQIVALRDTGTTVHVWGTLHHHVPDYNAAQIQVTRIEVPGSPKPPEIAEEPVEGWRGTIGKLPWGSQFGTFFERDDGQRFGIQALGANAAVRQQIETYQWTGAQVRVWGRSITGIPDVNGRRVEVERIEAISGPEEGARNLAFFATASASSVLPADRWGTYHAWSAIDDRLDSPWTEGVAGPGIDEWVMLTFPGKIEVWGIGLDVGYDRDADLFRANNRIKRALLVFSNGEQVEVNLADEQEVQMTALARAPGPSIETTYVKVVIKEVYPGTRYDDTCLGEIEVLGRTK
jgi:hypothetical protein